MKKIKKSLNRSKDPRKQRKLLAKAPLHIRQNFMRVMLSKELRTKNKKRNIQLRKGDEVKVMRGQFRGKTGNVKEVMLKKVKVYVEGIELVKKDGAKAQYPIHPSNLMITKIVSEDKKRNKAMERK